MMPAVSPAKLAASPAVLPLKRRVTGSSSLPPFCRMDRVTAKSAALRTATAAKRARFSLSQNLWRLGASGKELASTIGEDSTAPDDLPFNGAELPATESSKPKLREPSLRVAMDTA